MALAVSQLARGAWAIGLVLAVLSLIVSSSVRFASPFRPAQPQPVSSFTPEEVRAYQTLGLSVGADRRAVKEAWKRLMKEAHPDQGGDVKRASALNAARDLLLRRR
jgi:DnaJ-domain-containing protein 1